MSPVPGTKCPRYQGQNVPGLLYSNRHMQMLQSAEGAPQQLRKTHILRTSARETTCTCMGLTCDFGVDILAHACYNESEELRSQLPT